jgi:hypothetical protein
MIDLAVKGLGALHALAGFACLHVGLNVLALPESEELSRARIRYVGLRAVFTSVALTLCAIAAWQRPSVAWIFALISLLMYLPAPASLRAANRAPSARVSVVPTYVRCIPFVATARVMGVLLLALAAYLPGG